MIKDRTDWGVQSSASIVTKHPNDDDDDCFKVKATHIANFTKMRLAGFKQCMDIGLIKYWPIVIFLKIIMPPPLIGGGIKRCFCLTSAVCLTSVCLTSVAYIVNIYGAHNYRKQGALGAAGQACMGWSWAAACGAYRGGGISWRPPAYNLFRF